MKLPLSIFCFLLFAVLSPAQWVVSNVTLGGVQGRNSGGPFYPAPSASFTASGFVAGYTNSTYVSNTITFTDTSATPKPTGAITYAWSFGDGGTSTNQNPTYFYNTGGTRTVTETVTDSGGFSIASLVLHVANPVNVFLPLDAVPLGQTPTTNELISDMAGNAGQSVGLVSNSYQYPGGTVAEGYGQTMLCPVNIVGATNLYFGSASNDILVLVSNVFGTQRFLSWQFNAPQSNVTYAFWFNPNIQANTGAYDPFNTRDKSQNSNQIAMNFHGNLPAIPPNYGPRIEWDGGGTNASQYSAYVSTPSNNWSWVCYQCTMSNTIEWAWNAQGQLVGSNMLQYTNPPGVGFWWFDLGEFNLSNFFTTSGSNQFSCLCIATNLPNGVPIAP
jgi:PKD repeat protein